MMTEDKNKEIERLKEQVKNMEKLASLGVLSAGIAHEIQNPLNFVINFSKTSMQLINDLRDLGNDSEEVKTEEWQEEFQETLEYLDENLRKITEHGERAVSVIRGILLYSRGKEDEFVKTDICHLVKEYVWLAYHAIRADNKDFNVSIKEHYEADLPPVELVPQDFCRAVLNLMNNAFYALMAKTKNRVADFQPEVKIAVDRIDEGVRLVIEDNGVGIPETVKEKVFTPFFTTKPVGEGTGLGLSITRSIVEEKHKGKIVLHTAEGQGTRFEIWIPRENGVSEMKFEHD